MLIKKATYKKVKVMQRRQVTPEVYGCDECRKKMGEYPNESSRLELTVFHNGSENTDHLHFCSWLCVLKHIPKIKTDYFVSLPYLYFDERNTPERHADALIKLLKKLKP